MSNTLIDLHVHTTAGSLDSHLKPADLGSAVRARGVDGVLLAEHSSQWKRARAAELSAEQGILALAAREWSSPLGHMIILGLQPGSPWEQRNKLRREVTESTETVPHMAYPAAAVAEMRQIVDDCGGFMILAHPFRYFGGPDNLLFGGVARPDELTIAALAQHPVFEFIDEIEVANGGCTVRENALARAVADRLGFAGVAGSDAHSRHEVGRCSTVFDQRPSSVEELVALLRTRRHSPRLSG